MAKVKEPLKSGDARGRFGELVFTHDRGGGSVVRRHKDPNNPRTALQQAQRRKFKSAQGMYLRGFNDYAAALNAIGKALIETYYAELAQFKQENPVETKYFANGFESGKVLNRDYAIGHSLRNELLVRKLDDGSIVNVSPDARRIVCFDLAGANVGVVDLNVGEAKPLPANTELIAVATNDFNSVGWTTVGEVGVSLNFTLRNTELIVLSTMQVFESDED